MKRLKLLALLLLVTAFSCRSYPVIPELSSKELKISSKFSEFKELTFDNNNNIYFIENNQIIKLDENNNKVSILGGKKNPDKYPEDEIIDGDISSAKFGEISNIKYVESEKSIQFSERFYKEKFIIIDKIKKKPLPPEIILFSRKIDSSNQVKTIKKIDIDSLNKEILDKNKEILKGFEIYGNEVLFEKISDSKGNIYLNLRYDYFSSNTVIYQFIDNNWRELSSKNIINSIFLDENDNLYIMEYPDNYDDLGYRFRHPIDNQIILHKVPQKDLKNNNLRYDIANNKYFLGFLPSKKYYTYLAIRDKTKTLFASKGNSIFKFNLEKKKL